MKILFVSGREISYSRNSIILNILKENHEVRVCVTKFKSYPIRILTTFFKLFYYNLRYKKDMIFVGFFGQPFVPFIRLFSSKRIIFDAYISMYNTLVEDRKLIKNYFLKKFIKYYEKLSCLSANLILMDTNQNIYYLKRLCKLKDSDFRRLLVGVDDTVFKKRSFLVKTKTCNIYFCGSFIPLHGVEYIIGAAKILRDENIHFHIIGKGQTYNLCRGIVKKSNLNNVTFYGLQKFEDLPSLLSKADIGLGIFGDTLKTKIINPNKVYQLAALSVPIISARTPAIEEVFTHKKDIYLCEPANSESLARAIMDLKDDTKLKQKLSLNVYNLCHSTFSIQALSKTLNSFLVNKNK